MRKQSDHASPPHQHGQGRGLVLRSHLARSDSGGLFHTGASAYRIELFHSMPLCVSILTKLAIWAFRFPPKVGCTSLIEIHVPGDHAVDAENLANAASRGIADFAPRTTSFRKTRRIDSAISLFGLVRD